jgi:glycosyltransferase involved in cell wall biosynthesis
MTAGASWPGFSVVMPTHQRRERLRRTLGRVAQVEYPRDRLELVLVCDGCSDGSAAMARSLELPFPVRVLEQPQGGPAAARNLGMASARGPFVLFLDDDVLPSPGLVAEHATAHVETTGEERVVIGALLPPPGRRSPWVQWELDTVLKQYAAMEAGEWDPTPRQFYTGNASVRLEHVVAAGGFDPGFRRAEDVELAFRLQRRGLSFVFRSAAAAEHHADRPFASWLAAAYAYGRNDVILGLRRGRPDLLGAVAREFRQRNRLTRELVRAALAVPGLERVLAVPAHPAVVLASRLRRRGLSHGMCSALFNAAYWHGVRDELGGSRAARELLAAAE